MTSLEKVRKKNGLFYKNLFERSREAIVVSNSEGKIIHANPAAARLFGYNNADEMLYKFSVILYANPEQRNVLIKELEEFDYFEDHEVEFIRQDEKKTRFIALVSATRVKDKNGVLLHTEAFLIDITARKRAEKALFESETRARNIIMHLEEIREKERLKIAADLHDDLGQQLTAINLDIAWLRMKLIRVPSQVKERLGIISTSVLNAIKTIQTLSSELRPGILDDLGLIDAINWQLNEINKRTGLKLNFSYRPDNLKISQVISLQLFRIIQEALTNIIRHARATSVEIVLNEETEFYYLKIADNGCGITETAVYDPRSFGISGMKERVRILGGCFNIVGKENSGTVIRISIPISRVNDRNNNNR